MKYSISRVRLLKLVDKLIQNTKGPVNELVNQKEYPNSVFIVGGDGKELFEIEGSGVPGEDIADYATLKPHTLWVEANLWDSISDYLSIDGYEDIKTLFSQYGEYKGMGNVEAKHTFEYHFGRRGNHPGDSIAPWQEMAHHPDYDYNDEPINEGYSFSDERLEKIKNGPELEYYRRELKKISEPYKTRKKFRNHQPEAYILAVELGILKDLQDWIDNVSIMKLRNKTNE